MQYCVCGKDECVECGVCEYCVEVCDCLKCECENKGECNLCKKRKTNEKLSFIENLKRDECFELDLEEIEDIIYTNGKWDAGSIAILKNGEMIVRTLNLGRLTSMYLHIDKEVLKKIKK